MIEQISTGVWRAGSRFVNWYVLDCGVDGLAVVDAGLPGYRKHLGVTLAKIGKSLSDVTVVYLTHGHIDHVGMASDMAAEGAEVYLHSADSRLAQDPSANETDATLARYLLWPATLGFVAHAVVNGATTRTPMPELRQLENQDSAALPGRPRVLHAPGHTAGSCILEFQDHDVACIGDVLCTTSPRSGRPTEPQIQSRGSNESSSQALTSVSKLRDVSSRILLPGHGGPWSGGSEAAIANAHKVGCR